MSAGGIQLFSNFSPGISFQQCKSSSRLQGFLAFITALLYNFGEFIDLILKARLN